MKNILKWSLFILAIGFFVASCNSDPTYADKLKDERKNISRFMNDNNFVVIDNYPENGVFAENEFYRDPDTGVYINVIDSGNGNRAKAEDLANVYFRFWETATLPADKSTIEKTNDTAGGLQPVSFIYGNSNSYIIYANTDYYKYIYLSPGVTVPLKYVGEGAVVRLIVPFGQGSGYQNYAYQALYYGRLKYVRIIN